LTPPPEKKFPPGMVPLGDAIFTFSCHPKVACFTRCCRQVDLTLYPYDLLRLRRPLAIGSEELLRRHVRLVPGDNPFFPTVKLRLDEAGSCPFLKEDGCQVYADRPTACRTYPLERAVERNSTKAIPDEYYFLVHHPYCLGHQEEVPQTVSSWIRGQGLHPYNGMNALWTEIDTLFAGNPWRGEGAGGERQRLAFLACYNIDGWRRYVEQQQLLKGLQVRKEQRRLIEKDDQELLKFGFQWLQLVLTGRSPLLSK
jgi:uncharacterized protein